MDHAAGRCSAQSAEAGVGRVASGWPVRRGPERKPTRARSIAARLVLLSAVAVPSAAHGSEAPDRDLSVDAVGRPAGVMATGDHGVAGCSTGWVRSWGAAPTDAPPGLVSDLTVRNVITPLAEGRQVRVRLSNRFGTAPLVVGAVTIAPSLGGPDIDEREVRAFTFSGRKVVTIPAGGEVLSDGSRFAVQAFRDYAVSIHLPGTAASVTRHSTGRQTSFLSLAGSGDRTATSAAAQFATSTLNRLVLSGLDVRRSGSARSLVAFGDSITDGFQGNVTPATESSVGVDEPVRYPDFLAQRILRAGLDLGVSNAGISGNRVASDGLLPEYGRSAIERAEEDILSVPSVTTALIMEGTNDLGQSPDSMGEAPRVIDGLERITKLLQERGIRVGLGTIPPAAGTIPRPASYGSPSYEAARTQVNTWIRTSGTADFVVDFDEVLRDPAEPSELRSEYDSSDTLHPSTAGYKAMADAVPLDELARGACD